MSRDSSQSGGLSRVRQQVGTHLSSLLLKKLKAVGLHGAASAFSPVISDLREHARD